MGDEGDDDKHVHFVLLAEFDIDKGSILKCEYPSRTGCDEGYLSALMLPEGAHNVSEDTTVFFLTTQQRELPDTAAQKHRRVPSNPEEDWFKIRVPATLLRRDEASNEWLAFGKEDPTHVVVGCTLVPPCLVVWSPPNAAANAAPSTAPLLCVDITSELQYTELQPEFISFVDPSGQAYGIVFEDADQQWQVTRCVRRAQEGRAKEGAPVDQGRIGNLDADPLLHPTVTSLQAGTLCCLNVVQTRLLRSARRGAVVKAVAVCSPHRFFHAFQPFLQATLGRLYECDEKGGKVEECLHELYTQLNAIDLAQMHYPLPIERQLHWLLNTAKTSQQPSEGSARRAGHPNRRSMAIGKTSAGAPAPMTHTAQVQYGPTRVPIDLPLCLGVDEAGDVSVSAVVRVFRENTAVIYNAVLVGARVLFLGYKSPAGEVGRIVLSSCLLVSPPLYGTLARAFPCAALSHLDFLQTPGYIAGVTNPMFAHHTGWWDVLCDMSDGSVRVSDKWQHAQAFENGIKAGHNSIPHPPFSNVEGEEGAKLPERASGESGPPKPQLPNNDQGEGESEGQGEGQGERGGERERSSEAGEVVKEVVQLPAPLDGVLPTPQGPPGDDGGAGRDEGRGGEEGRERVRQMRINYETAFFERVLSCVDANCDEAWIRSLFRDHTQEVLDLAMGRGEVNDPRLRATVHRANRYRLQVLRTTPPFHSYEKLCQHREQRSPLWARVGLHIRRLRVCTQLPDTELVPMCKDVLQYVGSNNDDDLLGFLSHLSPTQGVLYPIAACLFHPSPDVKCVVVQILQHLDSLKAGSRVVNSLNLFLLLTYHRIVTNKAP